MPIRFEEVTGTIERPPAAEGAQPPAPAVPATEDAAACFERTQRLFAERAERLVAD